MESKDILEILNEFKDKDTYKKILINGKFGMGKSLYASQFLKNNENSIYISLFGKENLHEIENEIAHELLKKLGSKEKYIKAINKSLKNLSGSVSFLGVTINSPNIIQKSFIDEFNSVLEEKNLIILLDDFERKSKKLPIEDLLGIIEQLSSYKKIKIALIGDETKFEGADLKIWNSFKEKIIEKVYTISVFSNEAINSLVVSELNDYIPENDLTKFINEFVHIFPVKNLRMIKKGVKLFLEIINTYISVPIKEVNLTLLKTCLAVAIEKTEMLEENIDIASDKFCDCNDMKIRIERAYFNASFNTIKDISLIHYVVSIYENTYTMHMINELNQLIEKYLSIKNNKEIFYMNEENIRKIVNKKYEQFINGEYNYTCIEELFDDVLDVLEWYGALNIEYDEEKLKQVFAKLLFENYYSRSKGYKENIIDRISLRINRNNKFKSFIKEYNKKVDLKYYEGKLKEIEETFEKKEFDIKKLEYIRQDILQENQEIQIERVMRKARENNYFIADMSEEISKEAWEWTCSVWEVFMDCMPENYINELKEYINSLKSDNKINNLRIDILQEYKKRVI